ncbi:hypothetical protein COE40_19115 [Bacillus cereus]|nr:hypothetical protein COE40_19115 [Bacillus cereus]
MIFKTYEINIDLIKDAYAPEVIRFSQNDLNSAKLLLNITKMAEELDLSQAKAVRMSFKKPDGTRVFQNDCQPINALKGKYQIVLKTQTLTSAGDVIAQVHIEEEDRTIDTQAFYFKVNKSLASDEAIESTNEFGIIQNIIEANENIKDVDFPALVASKETAESALAKSTENTNQIGILSENINSKQDWNKVYSSLKVANDNNLVIKKTDSNNLEVYINHFGSRYQKWNYSRTNGFDNAVTSHANGNVWQIDQVRNVVLGNTVQKDINSVTLTKTGTWTPSSTDKIYSANTGDYIEEIVFGTEITLDYLALNSNGIAEIKVDGVVVMNVDMYDVSAGTNRKVVIASGLSNKNHTVRITVAGTKNAASSGTKVWYRYLITNSKVNFDDLSVLVETAENLPSGTNIFRYGQSAIEIALLTNINGNSKWAGTYHKYFRPAVADNQKIYIDGVLKPLANLVAGSFYATKDVLITQDLLLMNVDTDIAKVQLAHHFTAEGCHVKWILEWIAQPLVERSYNAMFGTSVDRVILGDTQTPIIAIKDSGEKGNSKTDNMIGWHTTDEYIVTLKGLNTPKMTSNYTKNMYAADRTTDFKLYYPKLFNVTPKIGEKWMSEFKVGIAKALNVNNMVV